MTDIDLMQDRIRAANPIPRLDDLDTDELALFVATVHTRRSAIMQTPTQHEPRSATPAPAARHRLWAFVAAFAAVVLVTGVTTLVLRGGDTPMTNEPTTPTDAAVPTTVGDEQSTPIVPDPAAFSDGWQQVATDEPWVKSIVDIDALPGGGFFVAAIEPWTLRWSPDGIEWLDADPQQLMAASTTPVESEIDAIDTGFRHEPVTVARDRVVILNRSPIGVWVGDPRTGSWELVPLDTTGLDREARVLTVGASDTHAMVIAEVTPGETAAWLIDLANGTSQRHPLPTPEYDRPFWARPGGNPDNLGEWAHVEWFNGRWLVMPSCGYCPTVYVSTNNGADWVESELTWAADAPPLPFWSIEDEGDRVGFWPGDSWASCDVWDLTTGPDAIVGSFFAHPQAYSADGLTWLAQDYPEPPLKHSPLQEWSTMTYSEPLGYVARSVKGDFIVSEDGKTWRSASQPRDDDNGQLPIEFEWGTHLTASSDRMLIAQIEPHLAWLWLRANS